MENTSGLVPVDLRILVKPEEPVRKIGHVHIPDVAVDKQKYAGTTAIFIAAGGNAFIEWGSEERRPKPGERVLFAQYSGARHKGADGVDYIIMLARDLLTIIEAEQ